MRSSGAGQQVGEGSIFGLGEHVMHNLGLVTCIHHSLEQHPCTAITMSHAQRPTATAFYTLPAPQELPCSDGLGMLAGMPCPPRKRQETCQLRADPRSLAPFI